MNRIRDDERLSARQTSSQCWVIFKSGISMNATVVGAIRLTDSGNTVQPMPAETSVSIAAASPPRIDALGIKPAS